MAVYIKTETGTLLREDYKVQDNVAAELLAALEKAVIQTVYKIEPSVKIEGVFSGLTKLPSNRVWPEWVHTAIVAIRDARGAA